MRFPEVSVARMLCLAVLPALALGAQAPRGGGRPGRPLEAPRGPGRNMGQDPHFMARLYQVRVNRIQQVLGLPEDRARALAERWARWDQEHMSRGGQVGDLRKQFHQVLMSSDREEDKNAKLKPLVDQFMAIRREQEASRKQFEEEIRNGLTPAQQARLILVMEEIQQKLREGLRDVQGKAEH